MKDPTGSMVIISLAAIHGVKMEGLEPNSLPWGHSTCYFHRNFFGLMLHMWPDLADFLLTITKCCFQIAFKILK